DQELMKTCSAVFIDNKYYINLKSKSSFGSQLKFESLCLIYYADKDAFMIYTPTPDISESFYYSQYYNNILTDGKNIYQAS
ncbi:MAG: hypothetical protein ACRC45_07610, partial [Cetobacterium sp.]